MGFITPQRATDKYMYPCWQMATSVSFRPSSPYREKERVKNIKWAGKGGADYSALIKTRTYASVLFERWHIPGHMYETGTSNHLGSVFVMLKNNWTNCQPFTNRIMDHISARDERDKAVFRLFKPFSRIRVLFFARFFGKICNCRHVVRSWSCHFDVIHEKWHWKENYETICNAESYVIQSKEYV